MLTNALIVNGLVLFAVLEADLGPARKLSRFRLLRPLVLSASIVPMFLEAIATHGTGLALEIGGDTLIIMAVAMTVARTVSLAVRANQTRSHPAIAPSAA